MDTLSNQQQSKRQVDEIQLNYWAMLLDLVPPILRAWKPIICGVLSAGVLAYVAAQFLPRTYVSIAYIGPLEESTARAAESIIRSPPVLTTVLDKFPNVPAAGISPGRRRDYLDSQVRFAPAKGADAKKSAIYILEIGDPDPAQAKALAVALIDAWLAFTKPPADVAARLDRELSATNDQIASLRAVITGLLKRSEEVSADPKSGAIPSNMADIIRLQTESTLRVDEIRQKLTGQSRDIIFSPPELPDVAKGTGRGVVVLGAMAAAFAIIILWIVIAHILRQAATSALYGPRFKRIGEAMPGGSTGKDAS